MFQRPTAGRRDLALSLALLPSFVLAAEPVPAPDGFADLRARLMDPENPPALLLSADGTRVLGLE